MLRKKIEDIEEFETAALVAPQKGLGGLRRSGEALGEVQRCRIPWG